jgi:hypothetical protein
VAKPSAEITRPIDAISMALWSATLMRGSAYHVDAATAQIIRSSAQMVITRCVFAVRSRVASAEGRCAEAMQKRLPLERRKASAPSAHRA